MNRVFDSNNLPARRLEARAVVAAETQNVGEAMVMMREDVIRQIARKLGEDRDLVKIDPARGFVSMRASVIVLTEDEYLLLCQEKFRQGVDHANWFRPMEPPQFQDR